MANKTANRTIRMDEELLRELEEQAQKQFRNVNQQVVKYIREGVERDKLRNRDEENPTS